MLQEIEDFKLPFCDRLSEKKGGREREKERREKEKREITFINYFGQVSKEVSERSSLRDQGFTPRIS